LRRKERMKTMLERVKEIIEEQLNLENVDITEETRFKEDLGADSLDLFELVMAFEEEYEVNIPSEELEKLSTVGDVIRYMQEHGVQE
jgi:acyl carrier protein